VPNPQARIGSKSMAAALPKRKIRPRLKLLSGLAIRIKAEAGMINEVTVHSDAASLTLLHVPSECLDAAGLAAHACSEFDRRFDLGFGSQLSVWNHTSPLPSDSGDESLTHRSV
jgi:hypothetical protein